MLLFVRVFGRRMDSEYEDMLLFEEKDKSCCVDITSTKDCQFITINSNSRTSSEARYSSILSFFYLWFLVIMYKLWLLLCFFGFLKVVIRKCMPVQVYLMDSTDMRSGLQRIREREAGVQYFVEHHYGFFYILTNAPLENGKMVAANYQLARCSVANIASNKWQVCIVFSISIFRLVYYKWNYNFPSSERTLNVKNHFLITKCHFKRSGWWFLCDREMVPC